MARRSRARDLSFSWCSLTEQSTVALYSDSMSNHPGPICRTTPSPRLGVSIWVRGCIGLILACIGCWNALPTAQAGCSGLHESFVRWVETKPTRPGELTLGLYVRYEKGSLNFTLERPTKPCDGPSCRTKSSMDTTYFPMNSLRVVATGFAWLKPCPYVKGDSHKPHAKPVSLSAPRGGLEVSEPPPKVVG